MFKHNHSVPRGQEAELFVYYFCVCCGLLFHVKTNVWLSSLQKIQQKHACPDTTSQRESEKGLQEHRQGHRGIIRHVVQLRALVSNFYLAVFFPNFFSSCQGCLPDSCSICLRNKMITQSMMALFCTSYRAISTLDG